MRTCKFYLKKLLKLVILNYENKSVATRNYTLTYCKTLEQVPWPLRLEKPKNYNLKKAKIGIIIRVYVCRNKFYGS